MLGVKLYAERSAEAELSVSAEAEDVLSADADDLVSGDAKKRSSPSSPVEGLGQVEPEKRSRPVSPSVRLSVSAPSSSDFLLSELPTLAPVSALLSELPTLAPVSA